MKNSIKVLALAVVSAAIVSCESKPSTMSYTLARSFDYIVENAESFAVVDSLYYNKYIMLDNYSALCTSCDDVNSGFNGGWRISLKKGSLEEPADLQVLSSAGLGAGLSDSKSGLADKTYAVYSPSLVSGYDIVFNYKNYFTKSTCNVAGFYINNTKYVEKLAADGQIADGDYLKVTAKFFKNDIEVCTDEFYLVDCRGGERKIVKDWTAWEMENAPKCDVDAIKFDVSSSNEMLYPQSFCLDVLVASIAVEY